MLEDFMRNLSKIFYLQESEELYAWVHTQQGEHDQVNIVKEKYKMQIKQKALPPGEAELEDRIYRYNIILGKVKKSPNYQKKTLTPTQFAELINKTVRFANVNIAFLKNMANVFKKLAEQNEMQLASR